MHRRGLIALSLVVCLCVATSAVSASAVPRSLIAPTLTCPHQGDLNDSAPVQERAMACLVNYAREQKGLRPFAEVPALDRSARRKSADILRCDSFSHTACGRDFTHWIHRSGYAPGNCWSAGENIAWGSGSLGTVRSIFRSWMGSPGHRASILSSNFRDLGVGLRIGTLEGNPGAHVWTQHFAKLC